MPATGRDRGSVVGNVAAVVGLLSSGNRSSRPRTFAVRRVAPSGRMIVTTWFSDVRAPMLSLSGPAVLLDLDISGYQYASDPILDGWDAEWLQVRGKAQARERAVCVNVA
jgi:hypothetical protein